MQDSLTPLSLSHRRVCPCLMLVTPWCCSSPPGETRRTNASVRWRRYTFSSHRHRSWAHQLLSATAVASSTPFDSWGLYLEQQESIYKTWCCWFYFCLCKRWARAGTGDDALNFCFAKVEISDSDLQKLLACTITHLLLFFCSFGPFLSHVLTSC